VSVICLRGGGGLTSLCGSDDEQGSLEKTAFDARQGFLSFLLGLSVFLDSEDLFELRRGTGRFVQPPGGRCPPLVGEVNLIDLTKFGKCEQLGVARRCRHIRRTCGTCPNPIPITQVRGHRDNVKSHPAAGAKNPPAGSQHGELGFQSTEDVGVGDGIEYLAAEGQQDTGGSH